MHSFEIVIAACVGVFAYAELGRQYAHWRLRVWMDAHQRRYSRFATPELMESLASWIHFPLDSYRGTLGIYDAVSFGYVRDVVYNWEMRGADRQMRLRLMTTYIAVVQWLWPFLFGIGLLQIAWIVVKLAFDELREYRLPHRRLLTYLSRLRRAHQRRRRELGHI